MNKTDAFDSRNGGVSLQPARFELGEIVATPAAAEWLCTGDINCDDLAPPTKPEARQERTVLPYKAFAQDQRFASVLPHVSGESVAEQNVLQWVREVLTARGYKPRSKPAPLGPKLSAWLGVSEANVSRWLNPPSKDNNRRKSNPG